MKRRRMLVFLAVVAGLVGCDHAAKRIAEVTLGRPATFSLPAGSLHLQVVHNHGAFLSLGEGLPPEVRAAVFLVGVPLALALLVGAGLRSGLASRAALLGLGAVAGGGLGNWIDRLANGGVVTDYIQLQLGPLHTGVFNLADVWILVGVGLVLLAPRSEGPVAPAAGEGREPPGASGG